MGAIVDFWQQHEFANAVPKPVGSVAPTRKKIPQHAAEFLLSRPLFASAGSTKSRLRDPNALILLFRLAFLFHPFPPS
jgi:hypothetical protein